MQCNLGNTTVTLYIAKAIMSSYFAIIIHFYKKEVILMSQKSFKPFKLLKLSGNEETPMLVRAPMSHATYNKLEDVAKNTGIGITKLVTLCVEYALSNVMYVDKI
jgi:hypothetical protein